MGFGVLQLMDFVARRAFLGAGLQPHTISLPAATSSDTGGASGQRDIHYWAPPGEPRLLPLLLIHGFGPMATWQWRRQVGPLSRHFHVVVPDLLCFGASSSCGGSPAPSEPAQAAALAALLDALPGLAAGARVAVVGTSYGGFVAYALARAAGPGRIGRVVISNSDLAQDGRRRQGAPPARRRRVRAHRRPAYAAGRERRAAAHGAVLLPEAGHHLAAGLRDRTGRAATFHG